MHLLTPISRIRNFARSCNKTLNIETVWELSMVIIIIMCGYNVTDIVSPAPTTNREIKSLNLDDTLSPFIIYHNQV